MHRPDEPNLFLPDTSGVELVLYEPEIPPNTGNIARTCAATGTPLHLIQPLGFSVDDRALRRAGLDYWPEVRLTLHANWEAFLAAMPGRRLLCFSTKGGTLLHQATFQAGDLLLFGPETRGLPEAILARDPALNLRLPMRQSSVRSLNLATSAGIALYEAIRQLHFLNSPAHARSTSP